MPPEPKSAVKQVKLVSPEKGGMERTINLECAIEPFVDIAFYSRVAGEIKVVKVDLGDRVKEGDILAEINALGLVVDERMARIAVKQAEGMLNEAKARVDGAKAEVVAAEGSIRVAESAVKSSRAALEFRKKQFARVKHLAEEKAVDASIANEAEDQLLSATEAANAKTESVGLAKAELLVKKAKLAQMGASLASASLAVEAAALRSTKPGTNSREP